MSGFFLVKREIIETQAPKLTGLGFKILLDIFASVKNKVKYKEVSFNFHEKAISKRKPSLQRS